MRSSGAHGEKVVDGSVWRHPGFVGTRFPAQRVLIDLRLSAGDRARLVRSEIRPAAPQAGHWKPRALRCSHPAAQIKGSRDWRAPGRPRRRDEAATPPSSTLPSAGRVGVESDQGCRVRVCPAGRPPARGGAKRSNYFPKDREAKGYTEAWFREFTNEVKAVHRNSKGKISTQWEVKAGQGKANEAWDCRIYATGAAMLNAWPHSLQVGLIRLALADAARENSAWSGDDAASLRMHLAEAGGADYAASDDNVVPLR